MIIRRTADMPFSAVTDEKLYVQRREFLRLAAGAALFAAAPMVIACGRGPAGAEGLSPLTGVTPGVVTTHEPWNTFEDITGYNNFYEFGTGKADPKRYAGILKISPWKVKIDGQCGKPADYLLEDLIEPWRSKSGSTGCGASRRGRW